MGIQEDIRSVVGEKRLALTPFLQASKASVKDKSGRRRWSRDRWRERLAGLKYGGMMLFEPLTLRKNTRKKEIVFLCCFFFKWTVFKVFIEFVTVLLLFYILVFWP